MKDAPVSKRSVRLILVVAAALLLIAVIVAHRRREARFRHEIVPLAKYVPIPSLYDTYPATARWLEEGVLWTTWKPVHLSKPLERPPFTCLGTIKPGSTTYYVLEMNRHLYLQRAELIEPFIVALYSLSVPPAERPEEKIDIDRVIELLPDDKVALDVLVKRIRPEEVQRRRQ